MGERGTSGWPPEGTEFFEEHSKLRRIGYWPESDDESSALPHPADLVNHEWDGTERATILDYLLRGFAAGGQAGRSNCRLCDPDAAVGDNGCREFTDGTWIWPEGFSHYVEHQTAR